VGALSKRGKYLAQRDKITGVTFDPAGEFQLKEKAGHCGG
jgi:hypothetical protein